MDLDLAVEQIGDRLATISGLRVHKQPERITPPGAVIGYPDTINYLETYEGDLAAGADSMELPIVILEGRISMRSTRRRLAAYVKGTGAKSVKQVLEGGTYTAFDTLTVAEATFEPFDEAGVSYMAVVFTVQLFGGGT